MRTVQIGSVIAGHRVDAVAGQGGMGVVYLATHLTLERKVALKVVNPELAGEGSFAERFKRESRIAGSLRHPHIVTVHDAGEVDGLLYITMEYVEGSDLRRMLDELGPLPPPIAARVLTQTASALDAAHERGLVHRDVKPANLLVQGAGEDLHIHLTDFGLTRHTSSVGGLTKTGHWVGTIDYVAPEQVEGDEVDGRADVYSLACVTYETLTGEVPFPQDNELAKLWARLRGDPPRLTELRPDLPPALEEAVLRGMARDPNDRFGTAGELAVAATAGLDSASRGRRVRPSVASPKTVKDAERSPRAERPSSPATPARRVSVGALAIGALMLGGVAVGAGVIAGVVLAGDGERAPAEEGHLRLSYDESWDRDVAGGRPIEGLELKDPIALDYRPMSGAGILRAGNAQDTGPPANPLPKSLGERFRGDVRPEAVTIGDLAGMRYRGRVAGPDSATLDLILIPTDVGYIGMGCEGPTAGFAELGSACEEVEGTVELVDATAAGIGPDRGLAHELEAAIADLAAAEEDAANGLQSDRRNEQAAAAEDLAAAYTGAAERLGDYDARPQDAAALDKLTRALTEAGDAYQAMAFAADVGNRSEYNAARSDLEDASSEIELALTGLAKAGYEIR